MVTKSNGPPSNDILSGTANGSVGDNGNCLGCCMRDAPVHVLMF